MQRSFMAFENRFLIFYVVVALSWLEGSAGQQTNTFVPFQNSVFHENFYVTWSTDNVWAIDEGRILQLSLNENSGTGVSSVSKYLYGYIRATIKLIPDNSAGTVTAFYVSSQSDYHDELDFEFLGNVSGEPYVLQTNVFANGVGSREQRINLWFDPREDFHDYSIIWNQKQIIFFVDNTAIRVFQNRQSSGQAYPSNQAMGVYSSIFDASQWATRGGLVKIDWSAAPFLVSYTNYVMDACVWDTTYPTDCASANSGKWWAAEQYQTLGEDHKSQLNWVKNNYGIYDYCTDTTRYPTPPFECTAPL